MSCAGGRPWGEGGQGATFGSRGLPPGGATRGSKSLKWVYQFQTNPPLILAAHMTPMKRVGQFGE